MIKVFIIYACFQVSKLVSIGGHNEKDMVSRVIPYLLTNDMQKNCNRSGARGKLSFSEALEGVVKGETNIYLYIGLLQ